MDQNTSFTMAKFNFDQKKKKTKNKQTKKTKKTKQNFRGREKKGKEK